MAGDTVTVGNVEITHLSDGRLGFSMDEMFPSLPDEAWEPYRDLLTPEGRLELNVGSYLLRSQGMTILVDTGLGDDSRGFDDVVWGKLLVDMETKGIPLEDVDVAVLTHLHRDHVGWNLLWDNGTSRPTFPNARYLVPRADWDVYTRRAGMSMFAYIREQVIPLDALGVVDFIDGEHAVNGEVSTIPTPGHTNGHVSVAISSAGESAFVIGDVVHNPAQVQETGWSARADVDPEQSARSRSDLMERIEREAALLVSGHFPAPGFGRLARSQGRRYWQPL